MNGEEGSISDLISRQATIDVEGLDEQIRCEMCKNPMHTNRGCDGNCKYDEKLYEKIMQILSERIKPLSSVELKRKKGKWIKPKYPLMECSICGAYRNVEKSYPYFCSNCGADMRGK